MFVYLSYPIMDRDSIPQWASVVYASNTAKILDYKFYNPRLDFSEQSIALLDHLQRPPREKAIANQEALKLDPGLFLPYDKAISRLQNADIGPNFDIPFKDLYFLIRADVLVCDMSSPSFGGTPQEVLYAYLLDIPIIGVTDRFVNSPWTMGKMAAVCNPKNSNDIFQLLRAFEPADVSFFKALSADRAAKKEQHQEQKKE